MSSPEPVERPTSGRVPRKPDPRIVDPATHPQRWVNFTVAAEFVGCTLRDITAHVDEGNLTAGYRGGKRPKIHVDELVRFKEWLKRYHASLR